MYKNKINIDWLGVVVDLKHDPTKLSKGLTIYLDENHDFGKAQKSYSPKYIESKNKHILKVKSVDGKLKISGNFYKWLHGQNITGCNSVIDLGLDVVTKFIEMGLVEPTDDNNETVNEVIEYVDYVQAVDIGDEKISTNDHIEACYKKCELRLNSLEIYLKSLLKKECILYRVHFGLGSNGAEVNQQIFSKNITEMFLRNRREKPISSMTGYFGAWREYGGQHTYLDLILVFDARKYEELRDMDNLFWELWKSRMDSVQQDGYKTSFNIVPLMPSVPEMNQQSFFLEIGDQSRRKQVFEVLVNYYSFIELYERQATVRVPKVLVKGSVTKTTVKSKVKTKPKA